MVPSSRVSLHTRFSYELPKMILLKAHLSTHSLLRGVIFEVFPFRSYAISPAMLPLLETFLGLLSGIPFNAVNTFFMYVFSILKSTFL